MKSINDFVKCNCNGECRMCKVAKKIKPLVTENGLYLEVQNEYDVEKGVELTMNEVLTFQNMLTIALTVYMAEKVITNTADAISEASRN